MYKFSSLSHTLTEGEASALDSGLQIHVASKLKSFNRRTISGEDKGDITNTTWMKSLGDFDFCQGPRRIRRSFLVTTANRHMLNLIRMEQDRSEGLRRNWDKLLASGTALRAEDAADHVSRLFNPRELRALCLGEVLLSPPAPDAARLLVLSSWPAGGLKSALISALDKTSLERFSPRIRVGDPGVPSELLPLASVLENPANENMGEMIEKLDLYISAEIERLAIRIEELYSQVSMNADP